MKLEVRFDNLEQIKQVYDPIIVEKATFSTIKQLHSKSATLVSKAVRDKYAVNVKAVKSVLKPRLTTGSDGIPTGYLVYLSKRISLRHFATRASRPKIKTKRGDRYGARVKVRKDRRAAIVPGAFWGTAKDSGEQQIFQRIGLSRLKIKKLTAPAIAQMVRGEAPINAIDDLMNREANKKLAHNLDHFIQKKIGTR